MGEAPFAPVPALRAWRSRPPDGVALELGAVHGELRIARDGCVRLRVASGALPPDRAAALGREPWSAARVEPFERDEGGVALAFEGPQGAVCVEVAPQPFGVRVLDRAGVVLAELTDFALASDGRARVALRAGARDRFFGFGEKSGPLDQRGRRLRMRNQDPDVRLDRDPLYLSIPFFLRLASTRAGRRADGVLLDVPAPSRFDVAASHPERVGMETDAGGLELLVFPGPSPADVLRRYSAWTGRAPRPPRWALGHHQSRWSYASEQEVRRLAAEIRRRRLPTDAIHLDIDHMDGFRVFTWHPKRFPDPKGLVRDLATAGFRLVCFVDPGVKADPQWSVFRDGVEGGHFCRTRDDRVFTLKVWPGDAALPDFARSETRRWWADQHRPLFEVGVAGILNDMNEPAGWRRELRIGRRVVPLRGQDLSGVEQADPADPTRRLPHEHLRNAYGHLECRATREAFERFAPERRPFVITRSGFAGIQRWAAVWTGDNLSTWSHLRLSVRMLLNLSLSGVPLCGADIGGFALPCSSELYARWIQIGALYPFARTHSMWGKRQEPWRFGRRVEAIARAALELRMRLLPYLYGLCCEAEASGAPPWRPLFWHFPDDEPAADVDDQVLIGPSLLAAPVLTRGVRERQVYLPPGTWFGFDDDSRWVGPRRITVHAPLERLPLFVRGGSVLPTQSPVLHEGARPEEPLVLQVFPGADFQGTHEEDDGESLAYRAGRVARTALRLFDRAGGRLRLEIGTREGTHAIPPRLLRIVVHGCPPPLRVTCDATLLSPGADAPGWRWGEGRLEVRLPDAGTPRCLEVEPAP